MSDQGQANGLAAAFLASGAAAYAGYFWPVTGDRACRFTETFYPALFGLENVGLVFEEALKHQRGIWPWQATSPGSAPCCSATRPRASAAISPPPRKRRSRPENEPSSHGRPGGRR